MNDQQIDEIIDKLREAFGVKKIDETFPCGVCKKPYDECECWDNGTLGCDEQYVQVVELDEKELDNALIHQENNEIHVTRKMLIALYNTAYHAGHNDTVEGTFIDVLPCDMDSYHDDVVDDWLTENLNSLK